jgi:hypothetical protein
MALLSIGFRHRPELAGIGGIKSIEFRDELI